MMFNKEKFAADVLRYRTKIAHRNIEVRTTKGIVKLTVPAGLRKCAKDAGVSAPTLSRVERGNLPDIETFAKLCSWMGYGPAKYFRP